MATLVIPGSVTGDNPWRTLVLSGNLCQSAPSEGADKGGKLTKFIGLSVLLVSVASFAFAGGPVGPEIDASSGVAALGLLSGGLLVLRARRKK
jgi:hypothetical protein